jgi:branched-chain amino acid transport system substrate-binding protein
MEYDTRVRRAHRLWRNPVVSVTRKISFLAMVLLLVACTETDPAAERASVAAKAHGDILIGAGAPWSAAKGEALWSGIELAIEELNSAGGIAGRKLTVVKADDRGSVDVGRKAAQSFVDNPDMVVVIGHIDSYISLPNSIMYQYYGMLMISPLSTAPKLTRQGFHRVFRTIPTDELFGIQLARFAASRNLTRVMIYHVQNSYGTGLANAFERECEVLGIEVPDRLAYDTASDAMIYRRDLTFWMDNFTFDGIFIAGSVPQAPLFIKEARGIGIQVHIMGGEGLDTPELVSLAGEAADGTFVGSVFLPEDNRPETQAFVAAFVDKYNAVPGARAAQGYDTVRILAAAIERAGSTVPDEIADALRNMSDSIGVTGSYRFDEYGDLVGRNIFIKEVRDGKLVQFLE